MNICYHVKKHDNKYIQIIIKSLAYINNCIYICTVLLILIIMDTIINHPTACYGCIKNDQHDMSRYYNNGDEYSNYISFCRDAAEFIARYGLPSTMRICYMHNGKILADGSASCNLSANVRRQSLADYMAQHPAKYQSK